MHPLEKFRYCPVCGSSHFEIQDEKSKHCENCGFEYFLNPSSAVAAFITNEKGELLVLTRKKDPGKGTPVAVRRRKPPFDLRTSKPGTSKPFNRINLKILQL